ncbi:leucine-rich repeat domain-containing protein [Limnoglobus roseus]|uniref:TIGR02996 domain-containing protein n=1 Tax=Limnoglobus roseus TaxID=2598579 RepID=A0A5C1A9M7_9BACT|nr:hypothetical protein [Limnoglobus roseus]QEL15255.1 TIGR02996 domain-containing protein [Limnoglobus roseus]
MKGTLIDLLTDPRLADLRKLDLRHNDLTDAEFAACGLLARSPRLRRLSLEGNRITSETVGRIVTTPNAGQLVELDLSDNDLRGDWCNLLSDSPMTSLWRLNLARCRLTAGDIERLAASPILRTVRTLNLEGNPIGNTGVRALARSPHLQRLQELKIQRCAIGREGIRELSQAPFARHLSSYDVLSNDFETEWLLQVGSELFGWDERELGSIESRIDMDRMFREMRSTSANKVQIP